MRKRIRPPTGLQPLEHTVIGLAHGLTELMHQRCVLEALAFFNPRAHVDRKGANLHNALGHIAGVQATREDQGARELPGQQGPVKHLPPAAVAVDVRVDQHSLGRGVRKGEV